MTVSNSTQTDASKKNGNDQEPLLVDTSKAASGSAALVVPEKKAGSGLTHQPQHMIYGNRPVAPSELKISHTLNASGIRPVGVSAMQVSKVGYIMNRPVATSSLVVSETSHIMGNRPVAVGSFRLSKLGYFMSNRPIAASDLEISDIGYVMGNRPIARNESDETPSLMGFID